MRRGALRTVRDVEIKGDVYVRMPGREEVANVMLEGPRSDKDTIKFPAESER